MLYYLLLNNNVSKMYAKLMRKQDELKRQLDRLMEGLQEKGVGSGSLKMASGPLSSMPHHELLAACQHQALVDAATECVNKALVAKKSASICTSLMSALLKMILQEFKFADCLVLCHHVMAEVLSLQSTNVLPEGIGVKVQPLLFESVCRDPSVVAHYYLIFEVRAGHTLKSSFFYDPWLKLGNIVLPDTPEKHGQLIMGMLLQAAQNDSQIYGRVPPTRLKFIRCPNEGIDFDQKSTLTRKDKIDFMRFYAVALRTFIYEIGMKKQKDVALNFLYSGLVDTLKKCSPYPGFEGLARQKNFLRVLSIASVVMMHYAQPEDEGSSLWKVGALTLISTMSCLALPAPLAAVAAPFAFAVVGASGSRVLSALGFGIG